MPCHGAPPRSSTPSNSPRDPIERTQSSSGTSFDQLQSAKAFLALLSESNLLSASGLIAHLPSCREALDRFVSASGLPDAKTIASLRRELGDDLADIVLTSASLQSKAVAKFGDGVWWASEKSLQQSTAWQVANVKASWFGDRRVEDLCCGIGGDTMALARRGIVTGFDLDPGAAELAAANLMEASGASESSVRVADVCTLSRAADVGVHIDPDRRQSGRRTVGPQWYQPAWNDVTKILRSTESAVVKLAPAAVVPTDDLGVTQRVWISLSGSVREQTLVCGDAMRSVTSDCTGDGIHAYRVASDGTFSCFGGSVQEVDVHHNTADTNLPRSFLVDPDASIRASGLTEKFAAMHDLSMLNGPTGFLTGDLDDKTLRDVASMAVVGEVLWHGSADDRKLRRQLRAIGAMAITVKVRGTDHDPAKLTRRYRDGGDQPVTLWIGRCGGRVFAAMTKPASHRLINK